MDSDRSDRFSQFKIGQARRAGGRIGRQAARAGLLCLRLKKIILGKNAWKARISAHATDQLINKLCFLLVKNIGPIH